MTPGAPLQFAGVAGSGLSACRITVETVKSDPGRYATEPLPERNAYGLTTIWTWLEGLTSASKAS